MAQTSESEDQPRKEQLEGLVQVESKITEAAEAAASAAAHAVEATKAAEAASKARVAKRAKAKASKAASTAKTAQGKAAKAAKAASQAKALSEPTVADADTHVLELRVTGDELEQIEHLAAQKGLDAPALARSLLMKSLAKTKRSS